MAYNETYNTTDVKEAFVDVFAVGLVEVVNLVGIIILVVVAGFFVTWINKATKGLR